MIRLYTWSTPNGVKISIALEEFGLDYEVIPIDIGIVDGDVSLFESGAILLYLAHKTGKLAPPQGSPEYFQMMQWLMWQMAHFGPMLGQVHHFLKFNPGKSEYAEHRYYQEALRLYRVLNTRLEDRDYIADEFVFDRRHRYMAMGFALRIPADRSRRLSQRRALVPRTCRPARVSARLCGTERELAHTAPLTLSVRPHTGQPVDTVECDHGGDCVATAG
jgi:GST-like protein